MKNMKVKITNQPVSRDIYQDKQARIMDKLA